MTKVGIGRRRNLDLRLWWRHGGISSRRTSLCAAADAFQDMTTYIIDTIKPQLTFKELLVGIGTRVLPQKFSPIAEFSRWQMWLDIH